MKIPVDKIGMVIGPKGQTINAIQDETGADISIEDDGTIYVGATNGPAAEAAVERINAIANPTMPKAGDKFLGTVVKTAAFGAFISLLPGRDGLLHISKVGDGKRVDKVEDFLNVGDKVEVSIADIDARGKIYLDKVRPEGAEAPPRSRLLAAGVPLKAPVAGIAMGLISDEVDGKTQYVALTDILGAEDAFGDMDFKVAGTSEFVTALQLDTKLDGIPSDVLAGALQQAHEARTTILACDGAAIEGPAEM